MLELFLSRTLAFPDQLNEPFPFVRAQFDNIALLAHPRPRRLNRDKNESFIRSTRGYILRQTGVDKTERS